MEVSRRPVKSVPMARRLLVDTHRTPWGVPEQQSHKEEVVDVDAGCPFNLARNAQTENLLQGFEFPQGTGSLKSVRTFILLGGRGTT